MVEKSKSKFIYIHGFNSSPQSHKAQSVIRYFAALGRVDDLQVPALPASPQAAMCCLESIIEGLRSKGFEDIILMGSSLGGYYATYLVEKYGCKAVLINPAVKPYELLNDYLGLNTNVYTGEQYELQASHVSELLVLDKPEIKDPTRYFVLVQTADETLDYRQAVSKFHESQCHVEVGGDHSFIGFDRMMAAIMNFASDEPKSL